MIVREFGVRQGRKALARAPLRRTCLQAAALSTTTGPTAPTDFAEPIPGTPQTNGSDAQPPSQSQNSPPSIFTARAQQTPSYVRRGVYKKASQAAAPDTTAEDWRRAQALRRAEGGTGSAVRGAYRPGDVFLRPPGPQDVTLELLLASQAHMGHHASLWNPANARYIHGVRQGIHVIALEQTAAHLRRAARVVEEVAYRGGLVLFAGTRPGQAQVVTWAARRARACHLFTKWVPGSITNSDVILAGLPVQMLDQHDRPLEGFGRLLGERRPLVPDLVVCLNPMENYVLLHECALVNVPTIGVIDTNAEPTWVTYAIPANDDSLRCLAVIGSVLGRAGEAGHQRRLDDAKKGIVAWRTPLDVQKFLYLERQAAAREAAAQARQVNPQHYDGDGDGPPAEEKADGGGGGGGGSGQWADY